MSHNPVVTSQHPGVDPNVHHECFRILMIEWLLRVRLDWI